MASLKRLIPAAARIVVATSLGVAIGVAAAAPFVTIYKYDDAGNIVRVSSTATDPENCGDRDKVCSSNHLAARACQSGSCGAGVCEAGWGDCDGNKQTTGCETSITTTSNCGGCGTRCSTVNVFQASCIDGRVCTGLCNRGFADCNNWPNPATNDGCETNIFTNVSNCGWCLARCSNNHVTPWCGNGSCSAGVCEPGWGDCNENGEKRIDGCETNLATSLAHCGGCGIACSTNHVSPICSGGSCAMGACEPGWADCNANKQVDGCETNPSTAWNHCGGCGMACSSNNIAPACVGGRCDTGACQDVSFYQGSVLIRLAYADCNGDKRTDGCETNIAQDVNNCGGCGSRCSSNHITPSCTNAVCQYYGACQAGWGDCNGNKAADGCETNLGTTAAHCGACGLSCSSNHITPACSGASCNAGVCAAGWADCNGNKQLDGCETSLLTDSSNCGACGRRCTYPNGYGTCSAGVCKFKGCNGGYHSCGDEVCISTRYACP